MAYAHQVEEILEEFLNEMPQEPPKHVVFVVFFVPVAIVVPGSAAGLWNRPGTHVGRHVCHRDTIIVAWREKNEKKKLRMIWNEGIHHIRVFRSQLPVAASFQSRHVNYRHIRHVKQM